MSKVLDKAFLESVFPPERTEAFFDALFGGAEEGAYDIVLVCRSEGEGKAELAFERQGLSSLLKRGLRNRFSVHPLPVQPDLCPQGGIPGVLRQGVAPGIQIIGEDPLSRPAPQGIASLPCVGAADSRR